MNDEYEELWMKNGEERVQKKVIVNDVENQEHTKRNKNMAQRTRKQRTKYG